MSVTNQICERDNPEVPYREIYNDTRSMILALSGLTAVQLEDTATELGVDYEVFLSRRLQRAIPRRRLPRLHRDVEVVVQRRFSVRWVT